MEAPAVEIQNLKFAYGDGAPVLDVPEFRLERGERVFLHGPSGSGKTTLLGILGGVITADSGSVTVLGRDLGSMSGSERDAFRGSHSGFIFQMFNLIPYLNVHDNIVLPCRLNKERLGRLKNTDDASLSAAARHAAEHLGIADLLHEVVTKLSVGQQQRVAAARALIGAPEIVIADEPTSALDADHRERFINLLFQSAQENNATILFVSHDRSLGALFDRSVSLASLNRAAIPVGD